jgi:hypothetical protein
MDALRKTTEDSAFDEIARVLAGPMARRHLTRFVFSAAVTALGIGRLAAAPCPPPTTKCGTHCCTGSEVCCGGLVCCTRQQTCCDGLLCCDNSTQFCCDKGGGACCNRFTQGCGDLGCCNPTDSVVVCNQVCCPTGQCCSRRTGDCVPTKSGECRA